MTMNALGAIIIACIFIASNLYVGGYQIWSLGYKSGAIGAWIITGVILILGIFLSMRFIKAYKLQKSMEDTESYTHRTGRLL